jgi:circadian clock protein KaiB
MTPPREAGGNTGDEAQAAASAEETWELHLYVTGQSPTSVRALANLERACAHWLPGRYHIEIIDLVENPHLAFEDQILAVPTLVKKHRRPSARWSATCPTPSACSSACSSGPARLTDERD